MGSRVKGSKNYSKRARKSTKKKAAGKKRAAALKAKGKGIFAPKSLSPSLAGIVGKNKASRPEVMKWCGGTSRARSCTAAGLSRQTASLPRRRKLGLSTYSSWQGSWGSTSSRRLHPLRPRLCDAGGSCMLPLREGSPAHSLLHLFPLAGAAASLSVPPRRLEGSWSDRLFVSRAGFSWGLADALASAQKK